MSNSAAKIYLVAGATRGIGLAFVADIAAKDPSAIIYAGGRNLTAAAGLTELAAKYPGRVEIVKYIAGDKEGNEALAKKIGEKHGHVDTVIANAGISNFLGKVHETPAQVFEEHFSVNVVGPIVLFQAFRDLLKASSLPRFVPISSGIGSVELIPTYVMDIAPYGISKAALNWITCKIHFENNWLVSFPLHPGPVDTDMTRISVEQQKTAIPEEIARLIKKPDVVADLMVDIIAKSTRKNDGGLLHNVDGKILPW